MNIANINELLKSGKFETLISELKNGRITPVPNITLYKSQIDPKGHLINDHNKRPDKLVKVDGDSTRQEPVARIALALQTLIVKRAVSFLFGNPILLNSDDANAVDIITTLKSVLADVKANSLNRKIARTMMQECEVAEYWHVVETDDNINRYGFQSNLRIHCSVFSHENGDMLYPYFNENRDLIAFSRQYAIKDTNTDVITNYFETFTANEFLKFKQVDGKGWQICDGYPKPNAIGKIPIVYGTQKEVEWSNVQNLIDRLEKLLSNFADTNDYHASPKIFITGHVAGFAQKGETGAIIEGDNGATATYLAWNQAPEAVKTEIDVLLKMIYTISQTPDISFENVKSLGSVSGVALKLLFMDSHLKVQEKAEIYDEYLQRRINILLAYLSAMNSTDSEFVNKCKSVIITPSINPYMLNDESTTIAELQSATGNKAIMSRRTAVQRLNMTSDIDAELEQIQADEEQASMADLMTPTI